jgi:low affinity Fe/Cu permease
MSTRNDKKKGPGPFTKFAAKTATIAGSPATFLTALTIVAVWACTGPIFQFNDTWQLVINTGTTIVTFLMVFLIQNTQNRDTRAMQIKLDELIRVNPDAQTILLDLEEFSDEELEAIQQSYEKLADKAEKELRKRNVSVVDAISPSTRPAKKKAAK